MDAEESYEPDGVDGNVHLKPGTGGSFSPAGALRPGEQWHCAYLTAVCKRSMGSKGCNLASLLHRMRCAVLQNRRYAEQSAVGGAGAACVCQPPPGDPVQLGQLPRGPSRMGQAGQDPAPQSRPIRRVPHCPWCGPEAELVLASVVLLEKGLILLP